MYRRSRRHQIELHASCREGPPRTRERPPIPIPVFRSRFLTGTTDGMGDLIDKTLGDPNDPIEQLRGGDRRALAGLSNSIATGSGAGGAAPGPAAASPARRLGRRPGGVPRGRPRPRRLPGRPEAPAAALAAVARRPAVDDLASPAPGHQNAGRGLEISLYQGALPQASSAALASMLLVGTPRRPRRPTRRADAAGPGGAE